MDFGPIPFKLYNSWMQREGFNTMIKTNNEEYLNLNLWLQSSFKQKLKFFKMKIKSWHHESKLLVNSRMQDIQVSLIELDRKIDSSIATDEERHCLIQLMKEREDLDRFLSIDIAQKAKVVSPTQSAFISGHQIIDGPLMIRACLQSARTSILVNDSPTPEFSLERGHSQGAALSFIVHSTNGRSSPSIGSEEWDRNDLQQILRSLNSFYRASGLKIKISKSNLFRVGVSDDELQAMAHVTVDKFKSKLSTWKASLLSIGGRLTLIKSVLGRLGIYYLSLFKASESIINTLERHRARFFWGGSDGNNKMAWVRWKNVLVSLEQGGLGVGILKAFNLALLQKWYWRFTTNPDILWVKLIKAIHSPKAVFDGKGCATC
ncbi:hypothetical protein Tco_1163551 [Tanacetum coccineum]